MNKGLKLLLMSLLIVGMSCGVAMAATTLNDSVSPTLGSTTDTFLYKINFTDTENDTADYVKLTLDGTDYFMSAVDSNDHTTTDGKEYATVTIGPFAAGSYAFSYEAANGTDIVLAAHPGTLTVTEPLAITGQTPPSPVSTQQGVSQTFEMNTNRIATVEWLIDGVVFETHTDTDSASYSNSTTPVGNNYNVTARATNGSESVQYSWDWTVTSSNTLPVLGSEDILPSDSGTPSTEFSFRITYSDAENETPTYVRVVIEGTPYDMDPLDPLNNNYVGGVEYFYNDTFPEDNYNYNFVTRNANSSEISSGSFSFSSSASDHEPTLTDIEVNGIPDVSIGSTFFFNVTYTDQENQEPDYIYVNIDGINETMLKVDDSDNTYTNGVDYSYNTTFSEAKEYTYQFFTSDGNFSVNTAPENVTVQTANFYSGDRIWDADAGQSLDYTWNALSYSGFYYDLESGLGSETMTIHLDSDSDRNIGDGDLEYATTPITTDFERSAWGSYQIIGFMAERYFAGYTSNTSSEITFDDISMMSKGQLSKVLIDSDDKQSVYSGAGLVLEDGYVLNVVEVDKNGDRVFVILSKDGSEVDEMVLSSRDTYTYEVDLGDVDDVPIIAVYFKEIFSGIETNAIFIEGIFQISDEYIEVESGDDFEAMEVKSISSTQIRMENEDSIDLDEGDIVDIMGKLKFIVADDEDGTLRFAPFVDMSEPGTYELRGTIAENEGLNWTPLNFEGFYYNIDEGIGTESLSIVALDGRSIDEDDLVYTTSPEPVSFERGEWGKYEVIGFMAEKYFAGYPEDAFEDGSKSVSMMSRGQLSKVLIDEDDKKSVFGGSSIILEEGYSLEIIEVNKDGDKVFVELLKDGDTVDSTVLSSGNPYIYEEDLGDVDDVPIIAVNFKEIFSGTETTAVFIEGIFQISDDYVEIESGDDYGEMEVKTISSSKIEMRNSDDISLSRDDEVEIMGDISFKVADSSDVRYYPFVEVTVEPEEALDVEVDPKVVVEGDEITVTVISRGSLVNDATVKAGSIVLGTTDDEGVVEYKFFSDGTYTITAEKDGYATGTAELEVISPDDLSRKISIEVSPEVIYEGNLVTFTIVKAIGGDPMEDVRLSLDGKTIGQTGSDGIVTDVLTETGMHKLIAEKDGFLNAELNIEVKEMQAKFEFSDLVLDPIEVRSGKDVEITLNAVNNGNAEGSYTVELVVNNNVTDTQEISLGVNETTEVTFEYPSGEPGSYLVKVGGMTATLEVVEGVSTILYLLGGLAVAVLGGAAYLFTAGGWTIETAGPKASEAMAALSEKISNLLSRGK
ncbi:S-layer family duplication domain-containing protein [Methanococcoides vulcani]|uniref:S-layer family duplication domain-containing protein n=3 Tax=Methanococcoides vulcani TaxID=1353158 RepID=A0A1H9ZB37_9EURY|nr:S-layer family duplication domain-containing protein [Methanococcoides vulcani]